MKIIKKFASSFIVLMVSLAATGCATYSTLSASSIGSPKVYSGTRLDIHAISGDTAELRKFKVVPPPYPEADLPFSFLLDTIMFPLTLPATTYEFVFE